MTLMQGAKVLKTYKVALSRNPQERRNVKGTIKYPKVST